LQILFTELIIFVELKTSTLYIMNVFKINSDKSKTSLFSFKGVNFAPNIFLNTIFQKK